jgi:hypothetical protein
MWLTMLAIWRQDFSPRREAEFKATPFTSNEDVLFKMPVGVMSKLKSSKFWHVVCIQF